MKFKVLALDYDGTIAQDGKLNAEVRSAIIEARTRGLVVVLVTYFFCQRHFETSGPTAAAELRARTSPARSKRGRRKVPGGSGR